MTRSEPGLPQPELKRVLGLWDIVFFTVVAVTGLRWISRGARVGAPSVALWVLAWLAFFVPLALAVSVAVHGARGGGEHVDLRGVRPELDRGRPAADDQRIAWLRHLVEWQREMKDPGEFMSTLKVDLYPEEVYAFTPRGSLSAALAQA